MAGLLFCIGPEGLFFAVVMLIGIAGFHRRVGIAGILAFFAHRASASFPSEQSQTAYPAFCSCPAIRAASVPVVS